MDSRVFAVVITYQSEDDCARLLAELARQCAGVIVVDNGSDAETAQKLAGLCAQAGSPAVRFIGLPENIGIAAAQNWGIAQARAAGTTHILLSDDDSLPPAGMVCATS